VILYLPILDLVVIAVIIIRTNMYRRYTYIYKTQMVLYYAEIIYNQFCS